MSNQSGDTCNPERYADPMVTQKRKSAAKQKRTGIGITMRLSDEQVERLDHLVSNMNSDPKIAALGVKANRSRALHYAFDIGLDKLVPRR